MATASKGTKAQPKKDRAPAAPAGTMLTRPARKRVLPEVKEGVRDRMRLPEHVSGVDLADLTGFTPRWLAILCEKSVIEKDREGRFRLRDVLPKIVAYVRETEKQRTGDTSAERHRSAKALEVERRIAREERTLITLEEALEAVDFLVGRFTEALSVLPAKVTRDAKERARLEEAIGQQRNELADDLAKAAAGLRSGGGPHAGAGEDDT